MQFFIFIKINAWNNTLLDISSVKKNAPLDVVKTNKSTTSIKSRAVRGGFFLMLFSPCYLLHFF
jgi:hypothetical protein